MKAVSVRQLKDNPSAALRAAREQPVMVLERNQPEARPCSSRMEQKPQVAYAPRWRLFDARVKAMVGGIA